MDRIRRGAEDALRQAFMSKDDYASLREEDKMGRRMQRPLAMAFVTFVWCAVVVALAIMIDIVFAVTGQDYPFCQKKRLEHMTINLDLAPSASGDSRRSYQLTEVEAAQYFWAVVFLPTSVLFSVALIYLFAGIAVAYTAPQRHGCLKVVENNCCASKRGGVRCLATLNLSFLAVFVLLALFLGSSILTLETDCSIALFWCYEVVCWGLVFLLGATAFFLHRKAAVVMDEGEWYGHHTRGVELLEATAVLPGPEMEGRVATGFKSWLGPAEVLSSSEDEESGAHPADGGLDDVWEEDPGQMYDAPEAFSRSRIG